MKKQIPKMKPDQRKRFLEDVLGEAIVQRDEAREACQKLIFRDESLRSQRQAETANYLALLDAVRKCTEILNPFVEWE